MDFLIGKEKRGERDQGAIIKNKKNRKRGKKRKGETFSSKASHFQRLKLFKLELRKSTLKSSYAATISNRNKNKDKRESFDKFTRDLCERGHQL